MFFFGGVVDADQCLAGAALRTEVEVIDGDTRHYLLGPSLHVLNRYIGEVLSEKAPDLRGFLQRARGNWRRNDRIDNDLPDVAATPICLWCHAAIARSALVQHTGTCKEAVHNTVQRFDFGAVETFQQFTLEAQR